MVDVGPTVMLALVDQDGREVQVRLPREWLRECDEVLDVKLPESVVVDVSFVPWMLLVVLEDVVKGAGVMDVVVDSVVNGPVDTVEAVVDAELVVEVALNEEGNILGIINWTLRIAQDPTVLHVAFGVKDNTNASSFSLVLVQGVATTNAEFWAASS
ncbi:hypothetical protein HRR75_004441 [Exophiala dermatitidis]|nr:hypothetical protein HRR75_004441 [Exophiala dermatitidis]